MTDRQFFWGLSNGAVMFTLAGFFWFGIAMSAVPRAQPLFVVILLLEHLAPPVPGELHPSCRRSVKIAA